VERPSENLFLDAFEEPGVELLVFGWKEIVIIRPEKNKRGEGKE
jgi:hypothetical protein